MQDSCLINTKRPHNHEKNKTKLITCKHKIIQKQKEQQMKHNGSFNASR
jgi:hypothetical protein